MGEIINWVRFYVVRHRFNKLFREICFDVVCKVKDAGRWTGRMMFKARDVLLIAGHALFAYWK